MKLKILLIAFVVLGLEIAQAGGPLFHLAGVPAYWPGKDLSPWVGIEDWPFKASLPPGWDSCTVALSEGYCKRDEDGLEAFIAKDDEAQEPTASSAPQGPQTLGAK